MSSQCLCMESLKGVRVSNLISCRDCVIGHWEDQAFLVIIRMMAIPNTIMIYSGKFQTQPVNSVVLVVEVET